jgi:hypothetical protein
VRVERFGTYPSAAILPPSLPGDPDEVGETVVTGGNAVPEPVGRGCDGRTAGTGGSVVCSDQRPAGRPREKTM